MRYCEYCDCKIKPSAAFDRSFHDPWDDGRIYVCDSMSCQSRYEDELAKADGESGEPDDDND